MKRAIFICTLILIIMGASGCIMDEGIGFSRSDKREAEVLKGMEEHLLERYGEFEYEHRVVQLSGFTYPYDVCNMYVQVGDTEAERDEFSVYRFYDSETESYYYEDSYYWHIIKGEYENEMFEALSGLFPSCKVYLCTDTPNESVPTDINGDTTFAEAKEIGLPKHMFWIIVNPTLYNEESFAQLDAEVKSVWGDSRPKPILRIFLPESKAKYDEIDRYNIYDNSDFYIVEIGN